MKKNIIFFIAIFSITFTAQAQLTAFRNNKGLWGFKDKTGKIIVEPRYYFKPSPFAEGRAIFLKAYTQQGVIDETGKEIVQPIYTSISDFKNGFAVVSKEITDTTKMIYGKPAKYIIRGVIDRSGKEIVPVKYKELSGDFSNGWFVKVENEAKEKIFYNTSGKTFTVPKDIYLLNDRIDGKKFVALKNGKYGIIDMQFKELLPFEYSRITPTENGLLIVGQNNLYGLMDNKLKWVVKPTYNNIHKFQNGYGIISNDKELYGAINTKGIITTPPQFKTISRIDKTNSSLAVFKNEGYGGRAGLVDLATGKILIPAQYNFNTYNYNMGLITYTQDNKKGMMDSTGKQLFFDEYDDFSPGFLENRAWVQKGNKWGFIDMQGKLVIPLLYDIVGGFSDGLAMVKLNGKYGYINTKGDVVISITFSEAQNFDNGMAWVKDENKRAFYIDKAGKEIK